MIVPNESVVTNVVVNRSTGDLTAPAMASLWVPPDADLSRAKEALARLEPSQVDVAMTPDGIRLEVHGRAVPEARGRAARRLRCASAPSGRFATPACWGATTRNRRGAGQY